MIARRDEVAVAPFDGLRSLWFQVTGLHCNLACTHCLVDSGPDNRALDYLSIEHVRTALQQGSELGMKEVYFTGGEPFLHKQLLSMLAEALKHAPTTVLTNGTLIDDAMAERLAALDRDSCYSLEIRISLDDVDEATNDSIRGRGVLARVGRAVRALSAVGLLPILTATEIVADTEALRVATPESPAPEREPGDVRLYDRFRAFLDEHGVRQPRVKIMPVFRTGRLDELATGDGLTPAHLEDFDLATLQCHAARVVAADGTYACPILAGQPEARLGGPRDLRASLRATPLAHSACVTCYETGMTCSNV